MNYPQKFLSWFMDLIFPVRCISCSTFGTYLCQKCSNTISIKKKFECIGCKANTNFGETCMTCLGSGGINQLLIVANYDDHIVEKLIKLFKYRFIEEAADPLLLFLSRYLKWLARDRKFNVFRANPIIVPVPLHKHRLNWRGFNQAEILAQEISRSYYIDVADCLLRNLKTKPQADIEGREARLLGTKGAFGYNDQFGSCIVGRDVILVDDVCTTGATLSECAKVLKEKGARKVTALVIARG